MAEIDRTEGLVGNVGLKAPCRVASTANLVLSGEQNIDGVAAVTGDRILVKNQNTGTENGIYVCDTGDWNRAQDCDGNYDLVEGTLVKVNGGTVGTGFWYCTTTGDIVIDTTSIAFAMASSVLAAVSALWQPILLLTTTLASRQALLLDKHGADIVSAANINLDTSTGDLVDVTGSTGPVTSVTLAEGVEKTVRFTGTPTLTHGASLVLPGAANIVVTAGSYGVFRGYAAGVVRLVNYTIGDLAPFDRRAPGAIGGTTPAAVSATTLNASGASTLTGNVGIGGAPTTVMLRGYFAGDGLEMIDARHSHASNPAGFVVNYQAVAPNDTGHLFLNCVDSAATRATIRSNGGFANFQANDVNLSDAEIKTIIENLIAQGLMPALRAAFKAIEWVRYKLDGQTHDDWNYGYIAQQLRDAFQEVVPALVDSWDDARMVQATHKVLRHVEEIEQRDGAFVLVKKSVELDKPMFTEHPIVDEQGTPVLVELEHEPGTFVPAIHRQPVMVERPASGLLAVYSEDLKNIAHALLAWEMKRADALLGLLVDKGVFTQAEADSI